uniref:AMP-dependent synthetase/ligase domain-containing protein n=2 Tax=Brassica oleracea var. oleracea TaxID=109376 RepID=A0A0D2ZQV4_BRAOL
MKKEDETQSHKIGLVSTTMATNANDGRFGVKKIGNENTSGDNPGGNWLPGAYLNPARNCLSNSAKKRSDDVVIRWRNEGSDDLPVNAMTLLELRSHVWLTAHALNALGLEEESAIAIDMPMNVESVIIYLAIVLAGHVVVSIADSFSPREISTPLKISKAKAIFTQQKVVAKNINGCKTSLAVYVLTFDNKNKNLRRPTKTATEKRLHWKSTNCRLPKKSTLVQFCI